jgi:phage minor structural protein
MIKLFGVTDTTFTSNGDKVIIPLKAKVHKEDNGAYYLDLETGLDYANDLTEGRIIVAPTPQGEQAFRVNNVTKTKYKVSTKCMHVFYDTKNYLIRNCVVTEKTCNDAFDDLNSATTPTSPFTVISDVVTTNSYTFALTPYYDAIQSLLNLWGSGEAHLVRDNFNIGIRNSIGQDNGVTVRYAKNLKDITVEYKWDNVATKLLPTGYDGIMLDTNDGWVDADFTYDIPYTKTVSFDQSHINQDDYESEEAFQMACREDLYSQAVNYVSEHQYPEVNYTLNANLEKITDIGDTVEVIDERLGVNIITHVIAFEYDCILGKYTQLEFGNEKQKLSGLVSNITSQTQQAIAENNAVIQSSVSANLEEAKSEIQAALGNGHVIYDPDKLLVVDTLPKESATNVIMITSAGIAFSQSGINGNFTTAWTIDGDFNAQATNVINFVADLIKGGTLKLGGNNNGNGIFELRDAAGTVISTMNSDGIKVNFTDGSYIMMNGEDGFAGYDRLDNKVFWTDFDGLHTKKSVVEEEITIGSKVRAIPITVTSTTTGAVLNDGLGFVSVGGD